MSSGDLWTAVSPSAFWCQLLASPPFLEPTGLAEGTVAAWEGFALSLHFLSLQRSLSYPLLSSSRTTSLPVSWPAKEVWAPVSLLCLTALFIQLLAWVTPWFSLWGDPQGLENLASCTPRSQELGLHLSHQKWTELTSRWRSGLMPQRISSHPSHTIHRATAWIYFAPGGRKG